MTSVYRYHTVQNGRHSMTLAWVLCCDQGHVTRHTHIHPLAHWPPWRLWTCTAGELSLCCRLLTCSIAPQLAVQQSSGGTTPLFYPSLPHKTQKGVPGVGVVSFYPIGDCSVVALPKNAGEKHNPDALYHPPPSPKTQPQKEALWWTRTPCRCQSQSRPEPTPQSSGMPSPAQQQGMPHMLCGRPCVQCKLCIFFLL